MISLLSLAQQAAAEATKAAETAAPAASGNNGAYITFFVGALLLGLLFFYVGTANMGRKRLVGTLFAALAALSAYFAYQNMGLKKGIDLQGGSEFIVRLEPGTDKDGNPIPVNPDSIQQAIGILEKRLNPGGAKDLTLIPQQPDRIIIQMPGISDEEIANVRKLIQEVALLELKIVHPEDASKLEELKQGKLVFGYEKLPYQKAQKDGSTEVVVKTRAELDGKRVSRAYPRFDARGWSVGLEFDSEGAKLFDEVAKANYQQRMAIVVDDVVISAPVLQSQNYGGFAEITGDFLELEARNLASSLQNPLENPMKIESERSVSAAYGQSSIDQGMWICIAALIMTTAFMCFIYRAAGIVAIIGLVINVTLLVGAMALFGFTLTMPGIAGIVLTIGMAVDANVLIYERLREEQEAGKSLAAALLGAFAKAFSAIFDSNITTLLSAWILYLTASGLVKGFAVTLTMGIISSLVGALIVTRVMFMWLVDTGKLKSLSAAKIIPDKVWDILSVAPKFIVASLVVTAISFGVVAMKGKSGFGVDFVGGDLLNVNLKSGSVISEEEVNSVLQPLGLKGYQYQQKTVVGGAPSVAIRSEFDTGNKIQSALEGKFKDRISGTSIERVGPAIGKEVAESSTWALLASLVAIFIYLLLRFETAFAIGAIVALFHDVLMVPGLCMLFGQQMSVVHVGALLTIAGYSINDTIVVFDRIRETIHRGSGGSLRDMMNEAICKTLSRTLLTGPTALAPMVILLFMGNPSMKEFALPMVIGVLLGTYSSIFIASPLVLWYAKRTGTALKHQVLEAKLRADAHEAAAKQAQAQNKDAGK
ncbi:MAG: protein translocase subunit SecD [Verrucomicrobiaceae bacterium]|nr:protein translocase subunit SecD [Verrucomicrobiaceae bacterium]